MKLRMQLLALSVTGLIPGIGILLLAHVIHREQGEITYLQDEISQPHARPLATQAISMRPGQQVGQWIQDNVPYSSTPWLVTDHMGAPMAWVNGYGLYSGGDGWKMPGGLICVSYKTSATVACLNPDGTLTLQRAGPAGPWGPRETLTPRDIAWLHQGERL